MGYRDRNFRAELEKGKAAGKMGPYEVWLRFEAADALEAEMGSEAFEALGEVERRRLVEERARRMAHLRTRPTEAQLIVWWEEQPEREYRCEECGKVGAKAYVQPQYPFFAEGREGVARCAECIAEVNAERRAARRRA